MGMFEDETGARARLAADATRDEEEDTAGARRDVADGVAGGVEMPSSPPSGSMDAS